MNRHDKLALRAACELFEALNIIAGRYGAHCSETGLFLVLLSVVTGSQREPELLTAMMRNKERAERLHVLMSRSTP